MHYVWTEEEMEYLIVIREKNTTNILDSKQMKSNKEKT